MFCTVYLMYHGNRSVCAFQGAEALSSSTRLTLPRCASISFLTSIVYTRIYSIIKRSVYVKIWDPKLTPGLSGSLSPGAGYGHRFVLRAVFKLDRAS